MCTRFWQLLTVGDDCGRWVVGCCCRAISDNEGAGVRQLVKCHERRLGRRRGALRAGVGCYRRIRHGGQFNHDRRLLLLLLLPLIPLDVVNGGGGFSISRSNGRCGVGGRFKRRLIVVVVIHQFSVFRLARKQDLHT